MNVVLDLMIHDIDIVQTIVGAPISSIDAIGTTVFSDEIDIANARIRFDNGCVANATASRASFKTERKMRVFEDDAYLSIDLQQKILTVIRKRDEAPGPGQLPVSIEEQSLDQGDALKAEIESFLDCIRTGKPPVVGGEDGCARWRRRCASPSRFKAVRSAGAAELSAAARGALWRLAALVGGWFPHSGFPKRPSQPPGDRGLLHSGEPPPPWHSRNEYGRCRVRPLKGPESDRSELESPVSPPDKPPWINNSSSRFRIVLPLELDSSRTSRARGLTRANEASNGRWEASTDCRSGPCAGTGSEPRPRWMRAHPSCWTHRADDMSVGSPRQTWREHLATRLPPGISVDFAEKSLVEAGETLGIHFDFAKLEQVPDTREAHRLVALAAREEKQSEVADAIFRAFFEQGRDIGSHSVIEEVAQESGLAPDTLAAFNKPEEGRDEVAAEEKRSAWLWSAGDAESADQRPGAGAGACGRVDLRSGSRSGSVPAAAVETKSTCINPAEMGHWPTGAGAVTCPPLGSSAGSAEIRSPWNPSTFVVQPGR